MVAASLAGGIAFSLGLITRLWSCIGGRVRRCVWRAFSRHADGRVPGNLPPANTRQTPGAGPSANKLELPARTAFEVALLGERGLFTLLKAVVGWLGASGCFFRVVGFPTDWHGQDISYGLHIYHAPIFNLFWHLGLGCNRVWYLLAPGLAVVATALSGIFVEKPALPQKGLFFTRVAQFLPRVAQPAWARLTAGRQP